MTTRENLAARLSKRLYEIYLHDPVVHAVVTAAEAEGSSYTVMLENAVVSLAIRYKDQAEIIEACARKLGPSFLDNNIIQHSVSAEADMNDSKYVEIKDEGFGPKDIQFNQSMIELQADWPGMSESYEQKYNRPWTNWEFREHAKTWAEAWKAAKGD